MEFRDYFSEQAAAYATYRPAYPSRLFDVLAARAPRRRLAWDAGTGNGQVAVGLAARFARVIATDPSRSQLRHARRESNVSYLAARAEDQVLRNGTADLVTAGQALHWIDHGRFYRTARAVLRPDGLIAVWTYDLPRVSREVDRAVDRLYADVLAGYWAPERRIVDDRYRTIPFPFEEIRLPAIRMEARWELDRFVGYLGTWSAVRTRLARTGADPVDAVREELVEAWGDPTSRRRIHWPLTVRAGRVPG